MEAVSGLALLTDDPRPSAVIDLQFSTARRESRFCFVNEAWKNAAHSTEAHKQLVEDCLSLDNHDTCWWQDGQYWISYTVQRRWKVIQAMSICKANATRDQAGVVHSSANHRGSLTRDDSYHISDVDLTRLQLVDDKQASLECVPISPETDPLVEISFLGDAAQATKSGATEEHNTLLKMIEMIDVGIFEYNQQGVLIKANNAFHTLSGHPRDTSCKGFSWEECVFDEDLDSLREKWAGLATSGTPLSFPMRWKKSTLTSNGEPEEQWVMAVCVPIRNAEGEVQSICGCLTDLTFQRKSEEEAKGRAAALERAAASELRFSRFAELANVPIWIMDPNYRMHYCNREWFKLCGHPVVDPSHVRWEEVLSPQSMAVAQRHWNEIVETHKPTTFELQICRSCEKNDRLHEDIWILISAYVELGPDGKVCALAGTLADISDFKWAEQMQKMRLDDAIEAKRQQENFIDITSHEIRNPLSAVIQCADSVLETLEDLQSSNSAHTSSQLDLQDTNASIQTALEATRTIINCSIHQQRIIEDTLTMSKLDSKLLKITLSKANPRSILTDIRNMFSEDYKRADVELCVVEQDSFLKTFQKDWIMLDTGRLMQVLINLVTNSLKFTRHEISNRKVTVSLGASRTRPTSQDLHVELHGSATIREHEQTSKSDTTDDAYVTFTVQDTGCGLDPDVMSNMFTRFSQASPRTYSKYGGSGLGLYISRELTELQGGEIGLSSDLKQGARFAFFVKGQLCKRDQSVASPSLGSTDRSAKRYDILVVEDNIINQKVLCSQLTKLGHTVNVASHGLEALEIIKTTSYWHDNDGKGIPLDVILLDVEMPVMDGLECIKEIRLLETQQKLLTHFPVIAVSANAREEQIRSTLACGMDEFITKPFRIPDLISRLERVLK